MSDLVDVLGTVYPTHPIIQDAIKLINSLRQENVRLVSQVEELKAQQVPARASTVAGPVTEAELATAYRYLLEKPSTSYLQRKMGLGYNRAAAIMETLESEGCVSAPDATGKRHILKQDRTPSHTSTVGAANE